MTSHDNYSSHSQTPSAAPTANGSSSQLLECLCNEKLKFAVNLMVSLISISAASAGGQALIPQLHAFAFSSLGLFAASLSATTFRLNFPKVAEYFDRISILFIAVAFASLVSAILPDKFRWISYVACLVPMLPSLVGPYRWLLHWLQGMLTRVLGLDFFERLPVWIPRNDAMATS